jgi:protein tyrosine phosphatase
MYLSSYPPDKHNRVTVEGVKNFYINASYMRSVLDNNVYAIFAQAPIENVLSHFWCACYTLKIRKIIMLCAFEDPNRGVFPGILSLKLKNTGQNSASQLPTTNSNSR